MPGRAAFDLETGREHYKLRFPEGSVPTFSSSPWAHGERVFCLSEQGETFVIEAGDSFRVQRTNLIDEMSLATPALAHGSLFPRTARGSIASGAEPPRLDRVRGT